MNDWINIAVNITNGKLEDCFVCTWMNEGSFAIIGANIEKKPKFIAELITVIVKCSH